MRIVTRNLALLLSLCLTLGLTACGSTPKVTSSTDSSESESADESLNSGSDILNDTSDGVTSNDGTGDLIKPAGDSTVVQTNSDGSTKTVTQSTQSSNPVTYTLNTEQEKKFASLKGTTVKIISNSSKPDDDQKNIENVLKNKYGMSVQYVGMGWQEMQNNIASLVAAGNAPDLCPFSEVLSLRYAYGNLAQPMDKYIVKSDPVWTVKDAFAPFTYDGKTYGAADYGYDVFFVYYNKSLFNEKHVKEPYEYYKENNWNFETFKQVAKNITQYEADGTTVKTFGVTTWNYAVFIQANGGTGIKFANGKWSVSIDQKAEMAGLQMMRDLAASGTFLFGTDGYVEFRQRKVAMTIERPQNAIGNYDYYNRMDDEIGMVPVPKGPDVSQYCAPVVSDACFVTSNAKNALGAVAYMYEKRAYEISKDKSTDATVLAERRKTISDEHKAISDEYLKNAKLSYAMMDGLSGWWDGAVTRNQVWKKIIVDQSQPSQVVDSIKGIMDAALKRTVGSSNVQ